MQQLNLHVAQMASIDREASLLAVTYCDTHVGCVMPWSILAMQDLQRDATLAPVKDPKQCDLNQIKALFVLTCAYRRIVAGLAVCKQRRSEKGYNRVQCKMTISEGPNVVQCVQGILYHNFKAAARVHKCWACKTCVQRESNRHCLIQHAFSSCHRQRTG